MAVPPESSSAVSERLGQALRQIVAHLEAVDDYLTGVLLRSSSFGGSDRSQTSPSIRARM